MTYQEGSHDLQEAMIPNRCCVICAKRLHPLQRQTPLLCAKRCIVHPPTAPAEGPDGPGWRPPFPQRPTCFSPLDYVRST